MYKKTFKVLLAFLILFFISSIRSKALAATYYIDCTSTNGDTKSGTDPSLAWQTLIKATNTDLSAGDSILLKKGCRFTDSLQITESGNADAQITIASYGEGEKPIIESNTTWKNPVDIRGNYIVIENLHLKGVAPGVESGCQNTPKGEIYGVALGNGTHHSIIRDNYITGMSHGVMVEPNANNHKILNNEFIDNKMMNVITTAPNDDDSGAFGILLWQASDIEIAHNYFSGQEACSYDYVRDGSAVENYNASRINVHHNYSFNNDTFSELGYFTTSVDNLYAYNVVIGNLTTGSFLVTPGRPQRTRIYNNSVFLTGIQADGVICYDNCGPTNLISRNNIIWANDNASWTGGASYDENNNIFWSSSGSPRLNPTSIGTTSRKLDPKYVSMGGYDLHLQVTSPAIDTGLNNLLNPYGINTDYDNNFFPVGASTDIGAFEYTTPLPPIPPGDVNGDRSVTIEDYNIIVFNFGAYGSTITRQMGDLNGSQSIDIYDYNEFITHF